MDDAVIRAMLKWPNVPDMFGWLSLDRRGNFLLKGRPIQHAGIKGFIKRNFEHDEAGRWFFQNGPQRVFVALAYTPMVYHFESQTKLKTHTDKPVAELTGVLLDEECNLLLNTEHGIGLLLDSDLVIAMSYLNTENGAEPEEIPTPDRPHPAVFFTFEALSYPFKP